MKFYRFFLMLSLLITVGCSNMNSVVDAPTTAGIVRFYPKNAETVKVATLASMQSLNIHIKKTEQISSGFMVAFTKSISAFSWGEVGRVLVASTDNGTRVSVYSKKRLNTQVTGAETEDFANAIFNGITEALSQQ